MGAAFPCTSWQDRFLIFGCGDTVWFHSRVLLWQQVIAFFQKCYKVYNGSPNCTIRHIEVGSLFLDIHFPQTTTANCRGKYPFSFGNFPQFVVIYTVKGFSVVNEVEVDVFLELSCFFSDPVDVGILISGSPAFSKSSLNIWKFSVHVLLKPSLENFEYYFASVWDECNCVVVWMFFGIAFLWDWNEDWPFPVLWATVEFSKFASILSFFT